MRLLPLAFLGLFACKAEPTILGGDTGTDAADTGAGDTANDTADDTGDTGGDTDTDDGPACVGEYTGTVTFLAEDPRSGEEMELCTGDASMEVDLKLQLRGEATCTSEGGGDPGEPPPADFAIELSGEVTADCAISAKATLTYGPDETTDSAKVSGEADARSATLTWAGELTPPGGNGGNGPPPMPYTADVVLTK